MIRRPFSFSSKLFFSVMTLYAVFALSFLYYQYHREKAHKVELLDNQLTMFNRQLFEHMSDSAFSLSDYISDHAVYYEMKHLRVTLIDSKGHVLYDNSTEQIDSLGNHLNRIEVQEALKDGTGYAVMRNSETLGMPFFYVATYFPDAGLFIRSALPYDTELLQFLNTDKGYLWYSFLLTAILFLMFYNLTARLGTMITQLRLFAQRADQDEPVNADELKELGDTDLGKISRHIVDIYERLRKTKDDLFREREKLIAHLQISNEGLAIFNPGRDVILTNGLFMQYLNLISDKNISDTEEIFKVKELEPLFNYITETCKIQNRVDSLQKALIVDKDGYIFNLSVVLFVDNSFEISISDITKQEEQARMKQQITQNISHELKTPVSSIQGYLETILNNPTLPPDTVHQFLERCFAQSNRLTNLLRDISALTRMTDAANMIDVEDVDLTPMIRNIGKELALNFEERHMNLVLSIPEQMKMQGNASLLYSIFRNLLDNALAYAGEGTTVRVTCFTADEEAYYFSVSDNGVGVGPEHLGRLFERFYRVDKGRSRKIGGTGLGLAIVKNAVLFHGGNINAKLANGDHGLEFLFTLKKKKSEGQNL